MRAARKCLSHDLFFGGLFKRLTGPLKALRRDRSSDGEAISTHDPADAAPRTPFA